ncbi:BZ3500_MvSof-1268-A1-R1_Chr3-1g06089 [Microbotryum saponariae]|uniref:BZ3500_MvSof-1268-A1-R1_Chr3-1g06089 protein n=1 Tax=Microbotryum saponariae TaxID=289078 RepID=A0A2X0LAN9_9BASI|nr:BZ3500_MvSof-1268-A1-R1_Chr3-1g06089 [Microbotryum saponariae]SDA03944.1 BZ3501_MvSof-1269-A2-R1_Chr3-2g05774 [Microbotryum saponariae]
MASALSPPAAARILPLKSAQQPSHLREQLIDGLTASEPRGQGPDDRVWTRSIPTQYLYSDAGLGIYSEIITRCKSYYPFACELEILQNYGDEIADRSFLLEAARMLGLPSDFALAKNQSKKSSELNTHSHDMDHAEAEQAPPLQTNGKHKGSPIREKWGDFGVGKHNHGVNGRISEVNGTPSAEAVIIELGSGSLDKTRHLLSAFSKVLKAGKLSGFRSIDYEALDLEKSSLELSLNSLAEQEPAAVKTEVDETPRVKIGGLHGLYDDGLDHLASYSSSQDHARTSSIMWLGSSIGNFSRREACLFLKNVKLRPGETMLIGIDGCDDAATIESAYNDPEGVTRRFILEGVDQAGRALAANTAKGDHPDGSPLCSTNFEYENWYNQKEGRHEAYIRCKVDQLRVPIPGREDVVLEKDELMQIEVSYKYNRNEALALFHAARMRLVQRWSDSTQKHTLYLVERPTIAFSLSNHPSLQQFGVTPSPNAYGLPSVDEWKTQWASWDMLVRDIMPQDLLMTKPIPLRHIPLFYLGHLPCFTAIHLSRYFKEPLVEPAAFADMFERGIDPDVETKEISHWHSAAPQNDQWPSLDAITEYQDRVRARVLRIYEEELRDGRVTRRLARILMMVFEHEAMHFETLVYIALQAAQQLRAPIGAQVPDFVSLGRAWAREAAADESLTKPLEFGSCTVLIGLDDSEDEDEDETHKFESSHAFGWDVEAPKREVQVAAFKLSALPVRNKEYLGFLSTLESPDALFPSSWRSLTGSATSSVDDIVVKTLYGEVAMTHALEWPVTGSAVQLAAYAQANGARLPTREELAVFHAANPVDAPTSNIGLVNLHPLPPSPARPGSRLPGASDGGVWLWTSTKLDAHEGFVAGKLYPGYSTDFFDGQHLIITGASYVTPARLARPSFTNFYQAKYPYVVCGARIAFDV